MNWCFIGSTMNKPYKPHIHAAVIKAWADGATIQIKNFGRDDWGTIESPVWLEDREYRVKPEPLIVNGVECVKPSRHGSDCSSTRELEYPWRVSITYDQLGVGPGTIYALDFDCAKDAIVMCQALVKPFL